MVPSLAGIETSRLGMSVILWSVVGAIFAR